MCKSISERKKKFKTHLGEADLNGTIDYSKADSKKNGKLPM